MNRLNAIAWVFYKRLHNAFPNTREIIWITTLILVFPVIAGAAVPAWQIIPNESNITFTGIQNGSPASGSFKKFTGTINFDPNQLNASNVNIVIDMNSVSTSYSDFTSTLITDDWFNVKLFPQAIFEAKQFVMIGANRYQANGSLTVRDKRVPVSLTFEAKMLSPTKVIVNGSTILKRTQLGVGLGEWADTDTVKDEVKVNFNITATKK